MPASVALRTLQSLPDPVRRFLLTSVPTVPHLEAILLLRSQPETAWTSALVGQRLYIREAQAAGLLDELVELGIARRLDAGTFGYAASAELAALLDKVAETYSSDLLGVTQLIHSRVDRRAQQFADAFRIRKEGER